MSLIVDSNNESTTTITFNHKGVKIEDISDILLLGLGRVKKETLWDAAVDFTDDVTLFMGDIGTTIATGGTMTTSEVASSAGIPVTAETYSGVSKFKTYWVNPQDFFNAIGKSWNASNEINDTTAWNNIGQKQSIKKPQMGLYLGDKGDDLAIKIGDVSIDTDFAVWADYDDDYNDVYYAKDMQGTTGFYKLIRDTKNVSTIMNMGYKMFALDQINHHLNWVCFKTNNYDGANSSVYYKYFRIFYRTLPNRFLFNPSLIYGPNNEDIFSKTTRKNEVYRTIGNALKDLCTGNFEYQDVISNTYKIEETGTYEKSTILSSGNVTRGFYMSEGQFIEPGDGLFSPDLKFKAVLQYDGLFAIYKNTGANETNAIWSISGSVDNFSLYNNDDYSNPLTGRSRLVIQSDENIVIYNRNNSPYWSSQTSYIAGQKVKMILDNKGFLILLIKEASDPANGPYYRKFRGNKNYKCVCNTGETIGNSTCQLCTNDMTKRAYSDVDCVRDWKYFSTYTEHDTDVYHIKKEQDTRNWCYVNNYDLNTYNIKWISNNGKYKDLDKRSNIIFNNSICTDIESISSDATIKKDLKNLTAETKYKYCIRGHRLFKDNDCIEWWKYLKTNWGKESTKLTDKELDIKGKLDKLVKKICSYNWRDSYPNAEDNKTKEYNINDADYKKFCSCYVPNGSNIRDIWLTNEKITTAVIPTVCQDYTCIDHGYRDNDMINQQCNLDVCYQSININGEVSDIGQSCGKSSKSGSGDISSNNSDSKNDDTDLNDTDLDDKEDENSSKWYSSTWFYITIGVIIFVIIVIIGIFIFTKNGKLFAATGVSYGMTNRFNRNIRQPMYEQEQPMYEQEQPMYEQEQPMYEQEQPMYEQEQPMYAPQEPMYAPQEPMYAPQEPMYAPQESMYAPQEQPMY